MPSDVAGKIVVITGASGRIGEATADLFLANGARVVVSDAHLNEQTRRHYEKYDAGSTHLVETDVTRADHVAALFEHDAPFTAQHAVKTMLKSPAEAGKSRGCLVFIASVASLYGQPGLSAYGAYKWAVRGLSLAAAQEFAADGIRSNVVQPGATKSAMWDKFPDAVQEAVKASNTLKRAAEPSEIAHAIVFLAGDNASFVNGASLAVHAGQVPT